MKQSELEERVAESLEQGYQLDEVRDALRSEGYSRDRIREAMEDGKKLYQNDFDFEPGEQDPVSGLTTGARDVDEEEVTGGRDVNIRKGDDDRGPEGLPEPAELSAGLTHSSSTSSRWFPFWRSSASYSSRASGLSRLLRWRCFCRRSS